MKNLIRLNQVWRQIGHEHRIVICGRKGGKWRAKVLGVKPGIYKGSHTLAPRTIWAKYELIT